MWFFTIVYVNPNRDKKKEFYEDLKILNMDKSQAWAVMGNFNDFLLIAEKRGDKLPNMQRCLEFKQRLDELGLMDIGFIGLMFICRGQERGGLGRVLERLDRVGSSTKWKL